MWRRKYIENRLGTVTFYHTKATCKAKERENQHTVLLSLCSAYKYFVNVL